MVLITNQLIISTLKARLNGLVLYARLTSKSYLSNRRLEKF